MSELTFEIGQIFEATYPPDASLWCVENRAYIEEIASTTREEERQELVRDEIFIDAELNEEGEEVTPAYIIPALFKTYMETVIVRRFQIVAIPEPTAEELAERELAKAKADRAALVEKSTVTVDGMVFNADEVSQNRLVRGIVASLALGLSPDETTEWTLADNSSAMVTAQQMARALLAAGQYQTSVWRMPYTS